MTSPRAATCTADRTHVRRRNWAGEPTLLLGEDARGYDELLAEVSRVLKITDGVMRHLAVKRPKPGATQRTPSPSSDREPEYAEPAFESGRDE